MCLDMEDSLVIVIVLAVPLGDPRRGLLHEVYF